MERIARSLVELVRDERGGTAIEYGLVALIISLTLITSATLFGNQVNSFLIAASNGLKTP